MKTNNQAVFCTYDSPKSIGGPFSFLGRLLPELRSSGLDCRVLALTHYGGTGPLIEQLRELDFEVNAIDCHDSIFAQVNWVLEKLHRSPPGVFVPNFVLAGLYAAKWMKKAGSATVGVIHSDDDFYRAIQDVFVFGQPEFQLTHAVCVSSMLLQDIQTNIRRTSTKAKYIPYGVDLPGQIPPKPSDRFRIAYVGRLCEEQKRISLVTRSLIAACKQLQGVEAVLIGDGPDRNIVETLIRDANCEKSITLLGQLKPAEVQTSLRNCNAIILLSDYEGLPIALLEGMAVGCIAICRNIRSGIPQLIRHGETGFIITENPAELITTIQYLQTNPSVAQTVGLNGQRLVSADYSHSLSVKTWANLIEQITPQKPINSFPLPNRIKLPPPNRFIEPSSMRETPQNRLTIYLRHLRIKLGALRRKLIQLGD